MQPAPTEREVEILKVLWNLGEASVREVHAQLEKATGLHFNTIQTLLRIMDEKGLVAHRASGRTFLYKPLCTREQISSRFLDRVFDGALDQLVLSMLSTERIDADELNDLAQIIEDARQKKSPRRKKKGE